jgi:hypothetical protein
MSYPSFTSVSLILGAIKNALERFILAYPPLKQMADSSARVERIISDVDDLLSGLDENKTEKLDISGLAISVLKELNLLVLRLQGSSSVNVHAGEELKELEKLQSMLERVLESSDKLENKYEILSAKLDRAQDRLSKAESNSLDRLSELLVRQEEIERNFGLMEARVDSVRGDAYEIGQKVDEYVNHRRVEFIEMLANVKKDIDSKLQEQIEQSEKDYARVRACRDQAEELVGTIASFSLAGGYAKSAAAEQAIADKLRMGCFVLMGLVIAVLAFTLHELSTSDPKWQNVVFRLVVSFLLTLPIGYCAKEASKHRSHAVELRKTALDMAAFDPYIKSLPESVQHDLKKDIAQKVFFSAVNRDLTPTYDLNLQEIVLKALDVTSKKQ